jgi:Uma2 family endonuclease
MTAQSPLACCRSLVAQTRHDSCGYRYQFIMSARDKADALYEQFLAAPEYRVAEIIHGGLVTHPRPASRHAAAASALGAELFGSYARSKSGPGGWVILFEPELHLAQDILVPDIAGWRRERMPEIPDVAAFELAPDWICEVLSPSTAAIDRADKLPIYAQHQVAHAWLVDPLAQTLEILRLTSQQWLLLATHRDTAKVRAEPFDALELDLSILWAR